MRWVYDMEQLNSSHSPSNQSDFSSVFTRDVLPPLYCLCCVAGACLNGVAAWIFFRVPSDSGLVVYLKNMVAADLLMLATFPFRLAARLGGWRLHVVMCRYTGVLFYSSMYAGMLFTGFISLERYARVVRPAPCGGVAWLLHLLQTVGLARLLALLTWALLLLGVLPNAVLTSRPAHEGNARHCVGLKTALGVRWHTGSALLSVGLFWATLLVLMFCYGSIARHVYRSDRRALGAAGSSAARRRSSRSIFSLLAVFGVCFVPYHVCRVPYTLSQMPASGFGPDARFLLFQMKEATLFLSALNVCLDPVVYFFMCRNFRESLLRKLSGRRGRRRSLSNR